jgi:hypothetical protein
MGMIIRAINRVIGKLSESFHNSPKDTKKSDNLTLAHQGINM